jgi:cytochrome c-type biogenesis protein CcmF
LVRSGVLSSVHAFAADPRRGLFILAFLLVVVGASLTLYAWRAPSVGLGARFALLSRETLLLGNNVLLLVACAAVLLGTLYPLALDALGMGKISVGPPYFDTVFVPLMAPVVFLMGVGPMARWKQAELPDLARRLRWALGVSVVAALGSAWSAGQLGLLATFALWLAWWVIAAVAADLWEKIGPRAGHMGSPWTRARQLPRAVVGMMLAHLGVAVFIVGVTLVKTTEVERDVKMRPGDYTQIGDLRFTLSDLREKDGPNYRAVEGLMKVTDTSRGGKLVAELTPEKRMYRVQQMPMTEAAIEPGLLRDLYVSLGEPVDGGTAWVVRVYVKPFIDWIWGGCALMALGGLLAASDRRYRQRKAQEPLHTRGVTAT